MIFLLFSFCSSFFQSVCTLGYCLLPLTIAVAVSRLLLTLPVPSSAVFIIRLVIVGVALFWSVWGKCKIFECQFQIFEQFVKILVHKIESVCSFHLYLCIIIIIFPSNNENCLNILAHVLPFLSVHVNS